MISYNMMYNSRGCRRPSNARASLSELTTPGSAPITTNNDDNNNYMCIYVYIYIYMMLYYIVITIAPCWRYS